MDYRFAINKLGESSVRSQWKDCGGKSERKDHTVGGGDFIEWVSTGNNPDGVDFSAAGK